MDREYILDKLGKIYGLPTFFGTAGKVINVIEDHMNSAADLMKTKDFSMASKTLTVDNTPGLGIHNFRNMSFITHAMGIVGLEETKEDREYAIGTSPGNLFAKKIDLRDNFPSLDEFLNNYRDFVYTMEVFLTKLISLKRLSFLGIYYAVKNEKVGIKE
jgi:hypothetical protein